MFNKTCAKKPQKHYQDFFLGSFLILSNQSQPKLFFEDISFNFNFNFNFNFQLKLKKNMINLSVKRVIFPTYLLHFNVPGGR